MAENMLNDALKAMLEYYNEQCRTRSMEYSYGYFDAMAVIKEMLDKRIMK